MRFKKFWTVYKTLINVHFGFSAMKDLYFRRRQRLWELALVALALIISIPSIAFVFVNFAIGILEFGSMVGEPEIVLSVSIVAAAVTTFTFSLGLVISAFYFSEDIKTLIPLPLNPLEVLTAKFATIFTTEYLVLGVLILPLWIYYGIKLGEPALYYVKALIGFVFLPVLPLVAAALLSVVLMRVVNISKRKDLFTLLGGLLLVFVMIGGQLYLQMQAIQNPELFMEQLLAQTTNFVKLFGKAFPPSVWLTRALADSGVSSFTNLLLFIGTAAAGFLILLLIAEKVFYKSVILGMEASRASPKKAAGNVEVASRSKVFSLALCDLKLFIRNPSYTLNGLISYVLLPFLLVFQQLTLNVSLDELAGYFGGFHPSLIIVVCALYFAVMGMMSSMPSTPFSREGKYLWNLRSLPVSASQAMLAKLVSSQIVNILGSLVGVVAFAVMFKLPLLPVFAGCIWGIVLSTGTSSLWVFLDLLRPMLNWTNPIKAVKSNLNVIFSMVGMLGLILLVGSRAAHHLKTGTLTMMLVEFSVITLMVLALGYGLWKAFGENAYKSIV